MTNLKFVVSCIICFLFVNSFLYADNIIENLQNKRNTLNTQGITYSVSVDNEDKGTSTEKCIITEKGKNKFFEKINSLQKIMYLLCDDGKLYQIYTLQEPSVFYSLKAVILPEEIKKDILKQYDYEIPDYSECIVGDKVTVNGYNCQIITKIVTKTIKENEQNFTTRQNITRMYVSERYGYPTRVEYLYKNSYSNSPDCDEGFSKATVNFINFTTDLTNKLTELPEKAFVTDYKKN